MAAASDPSPDDLTLMSAIAAGDRAALACLYDRHAPLVLAVCRRVLNDADEADDVLVDVFFEVWARADRFDGARGNPLTYLVTLARSRSIDRRRSLGARPPLRSDRAGELATRAAEGDGPLQRTSFVEQADRVRRAMASLDPEQRAAIESAFYDGLSHTEVAAKLGKPLGTVKTAIRQGLIRLREILRIDR